VGFLVNVAARCKRPRNPARSCAASGPTPWIIKDRVQAEEREPLMLKGSRRPVETWELVGLLDS
jgi:class 3 adenylate cyclase